MRDAAACAVLVALGAVAFLWHSGDLPVRGEESRWATVALEMMRSADFVVPRQQGEVFPDRPPLGSWAIALSMRTLGRTDLAAIRLPSILATLLTALAVYGCSRTFLSRLGAFTAGIAWLTAGQVLQLGRLAETEAVFTLCLGGAFLAWFAGPARGWPPVRTAVVAHGLAALSGLAKGAHGPVAFLLGLALAGRFEGEPRGRRTHAVGLGVMAAVLLAWLVPCALATDSVLAVWGSATVGDHLGHPDIPRHLLLFPLEALAVFLPWSALLPLLITSPGRAALRAAGPPARGLLAAAAVVLAIGWLVPGARTRYVLPALPCLAPLIGLVAERLAAGDPPWRQWQRHLLRLSAAAVVGAFVLVAGASLVPDGPGDLIRQPPATVAAYGVLTLVFVLVLLCSPSGALRVLAIGLFMAVSWDGPVLGALIRRAPDTTAAITALRTRLPPEARLVSLGRVHHRFAYLWGEPIPIHAWPGPLPPAGTWLCLDEDPVRPLSFAWEPVATIPLGRFRSSPSEAVLVGRVAPEVAAGAGADDR
jgi:4-amino-4-deoxy-L-arabinose transferase-like glycosyltransferase